MVIDRLVKEDHSTEVIIEHTLEGRNYLSLHTPSLCHSHSDLAIPRISRGPLASGPLHILLLLPAMPTLINQCATMSWMLVEDMRLLGHRKK